MGKLIQCEYRKREKSNKSVLAQNRMGSCVMDIIIKMDMVIRVGFSLRAKTLEKCMNPIILPPATAKKVHKIFWQRAKRKTNSELKPVKFRIKMILFQILFVRRGWEIHK